MKSKIETTYVNLPPPDELPVEQVYRTAKKEIIRSLIERSRRDKVAVKLPPDISERWVRIVINRLGLGEKVKLRVYGGCYYIVAVPQKYEYQK